jgi:hypothetical protein
MAVLVVVAVMEVLEAQVFLGKVLLEVEAQLVR